MSAGAGVGAPETSPPPLDLVFMGTPAFACPTLSALVDAGHRVRAVYTQPPRPAGRGQKLRPSPVHALAETLEIPVRTPTRLKAEEDQAAFAALEADAAVVVAYGLLLPETVLAAPRLGCFNLHASLLPRWRGAAPIHRALMAGDAETGVCAMRMTLGLDEGPVLMRRATPITAEDTTATLHDRLAAIGAPLMVEALDALARGVAEETPQPAEGVTYARKIDKAEARLDWTQPAAALDRQVRGLSPSPGAWFERMLETGAPERVKALLSRLAAGAGAVSAAPGALLEDDGGARSMRVACGDGGVLQLERVQRAGKGPVDAADYLRSRPITSGERLP